VEFDHLGAFVYSDFDDLASHHLSQGVTGRTAKKRHDTLMACQRSISEKCNSRYLGKTLTVLIEEASEENLFVGRTIFQAPEVDGITYVHGPNLDTGTFAKVKVTDTLEYDLIGVLA
jgi:ribosomal protein S12 methylthiotransferase